MIMLGDIGLGMNLKLVIGIGAILGMILGFLFEILSYNILGL